MLVADAIARIQEKTGYRSDKAAEILRELNDAMGTLSLGVPMPGGRGSFVPWFLIQEQSTVSTQAGEERLLLPSDFVGEVENFRLYRYDSSADDDERWTELLKDDIGFLRRNRQGSGVPQFYAFSGDYWRLFPTPDAVYPLKVILASKDVALTASPDNGASSRWLTHAPWLLISAAGINFAASLRDATAVQFFQARLQTESGLLFNASVSRFEVNARPVMGGAY